MAKWALSGEALLRTKTSLLLAFWLLTSVAIAHAERAWAAWQEIKTPESKAALSIFVAVALGLAVLWFAT